MDTFKLIGEINKDISRLDEKINSTDKSATIAFSYLLSKTDKVNSDLSYTSNKVGKIIEDTNIFKSEFVTLQNNLINISKTNSEVLLLNTGINDNIINLSTKLEEIVSDIDNIKNRLDNLEKKFNNIETVDSGFIIVRREEGFIEKIYKKISNFFFKLFHTKNIIEAKEEVERKELEKKEEEKQNKIKEGIKKKQAAKDTINNLLG